MCGLCLLHTRCYTLQCEGCLQFANIHNTGNMSAKDVVNMPRLVSRMPPLIPLPQPGHWLHINTSNRDIKDNIKTELNKDLDGYQSLHLKCLSCLSIVHSSLVPSCDISHLLCLPCWSVMAMSLDHLPLSRRQTRSGLEKRENLDWRVI
jgi:hypothetical protein